MTAAARTFLLPEEDLELRRWLTAALIVIAVHAALVFWLMHKRDVSLLGAPPAVVMIDLPAMEVEAASEIPPETVEGPRMTEATPEETETPETLAVPELPPAHKPDAVLMPPPKPIQKPKKKELPKPVLNQTKEPPAPRTMAPRHAAAARGPVSAAQRRGTAGSAASAASWHAQVYAHLLRHKPSSEEATGRATISFSLTRSGRLLGARLAGSSGTAILDQKALQMVRSANPFPAAPSEVAGGSFPFTVPVNFH